MEQQDWGKHPVHIGHQVHVLIRLFFVVFDYRHCG